MNGGLTGIRTVASDYAAKTVAPVQLGLAATTIWLCPASATDRVWSLIVCNTHSAQVLVTLYKVPSGGSPGASTTLLSAVPFAAGQSAQVITGGPLVLAAGDSLVGLADVAGKVTVTPDGDEKV